MLLNQVQAGSNASSSLFSSQSRDALVLGRVRKAKSKRLQVQAAASEPRKNWLESASSRLEKVGGFLETKLHGADGISTAVLDPNTVQYKAQVLIMKKLLQLDLVDRGADLADDASELFLGKHVTIQLVSTEINPSTGEGKLSDATIIPKWVATPETLAAQNLEYKMNFVVAKDFGVPGAIIVKNEHPNEFLLASFCLTLPDDSSAHYVTNSWIYNTNNTKGRIFFRNKTYLPGDTPASLKDLRARELAELRGDGTGLRKDSDRVYDYDVYNDLGDVDRDEKLERPNLGGNPELPYPRRCRTGRRLTKKYPERKYETRDVGPLGSFYIPRDECFDKSKKSDFQADGVRSIGHSVSSKFTSLLTQKKEFDSIAEIKRLFAKKGQKVGGLNNVLPDEADVPSEDQFPLVFLQEIMRPDGQTANPLLYPLPQLLQTDENAWRSNDEFAREFLAGLNPVVIELVQEWPMKSRLKEFGCPVSAIEERHVIEGGLEGLSVEEAVSGKRLFVADYHDAFLPFVERINEYPTARSYATRALFFLTSDQTLKVLALELALPGATTTAPLNSRVFTPPTDTSKTDFVWEMAKAHVANNDITAHQVFSHFSRCHAVTEAVIICTNRNLSKMHPIMQLMAPHFRSTLEINRTARATLIGAGGSIETHFTPKKYSFEMAAANYRDTWTFESQGLPNDLVARGMAVRDESARHGVKLVVEDYPYAADGLELWSTIKGFNREYVDVYYKDDDAVLADPELQAWWKEMREKAHEDKKDALGWPELISKESLAEILTTIQWISSCQHAAVNFGQYDYAGWMPHHPTMTRRLIPEEGSADWDTMMKNPEKYYLLSISNIDSTTTAMSVYEVLSAHSPNEEYIGQRQKNWTADDQACAAFERFYAKIKEVDALIRERNADKSLKNRYGAVNMPYQLLRPCSKSGVTSMGVPNSISI